MNPNNQAPDRDRTHGEVERFWNLDPSDRARYKRGLGERRRTLAYRCDGMTDDDLGKLLRAPEWRLCDL